MMATCAQNLLLYAQIGSAITIVTHTQNILLFCVQDNPAIKMATPANSKLHLIVAFIWRALTSQITFIDPFSISEGAWHAQINLWTFRLIVDYICCSNFAGANQVITSTIPNNYLKLIDVLALEGALIAPYIFPKTLSLIALQANQILKERVQLKTNPASWLSIQLSTAVPNLPS